MLSSAGSFELELFSDSRECLKERELTNSPSLVAEVPERAKWIRTLFGEITRILNHLMAVLTHAMGSILSSFTTPSFVKS